MGNGAKENIHNFKFCWPFKDFIQQSFSFCMNRIKNSCVVHKYFLGNLSVLNLRMFSFVPMSELVSHSLQVGTLLHGHHPFEPNCPLLDRMLKCVVWPTIL